MGSRHLVGTRPVVGTPPFIGTPHLVGTLNLLVPGVRGPARRGLAFGLARVRRLTVTV